MEQNRLAFVVDDLMGNSCVKLLLIWFKQYLISNKSILQCKDIMVQDQLIHLYYNLDPVII